MKTRTETLVLLALAGAVSVSGCTGIPAAPRMTQDDVLLMAREDISPEVMGLATESSGLAFPLDASAIVSLQQAGLEDAQVQAMMEGDGRRAAQREAAQQQLDPGSLLDPLVSLLRAFQ